MWDCGFVVAWAAQQGGMRCCRHPRTGSGRPAEGKEGQAGAGRGRQRAHLQEARVVAHGQLGWEHHLAPAGGRLGGHCGGTSGNTRAVNSKATQRQQGTWLAWVLRCTAARHTVYLHPAPSWSGQPAAHRQRPSWAGRCPCRQASCQPPPHAAAARSPADVGGGRGPRQRGEASTTLPHRAGRQQVQRWARAPRGSTPPTPPIAPLPPTAARPQHSTHGGSTHGGSSSSMATKATPNPRTRVSAVAASSRLARCRSASACLGCPSCS